MIFSIFFLHKIISDLREYKREELKIGRSGKTVKSRKKAIAIGLSQARKSGAEVPNYR